jgi:hypothetical protein
MKEDKIIKALNSNSITPKETKKNSKYKNEY